MRFARSVLFAAVVEEVCVGRLKEVGRSSSAMLFTRACLVGSVVRLGEHRSMHR